MGLKNCITFPSTKESLDSLVSTTKVYCRCHDFLGNRQKILLNISTNISSSSMVPTTFYPRKLKLLHIISKLCPVFNHKILLHLYVGTYHTMSLYNIHVALHDQWQSLYDVGMAIGVHHSVILPCSTRR